MPLTLQEVENPRISKHSALEGSNFVSLTHQPPLPPGDVSGAHLCGRLSRSSEP